MSGAAPPNDETAGQGRAHQRLRQLYEISKVLTRWASVGETIPEILTIVSDAVPLRIAILFLEGRTPRVRRRAVVWHAAGVSDSQLGEATSRAAARYAYLVHPGSLHPLDVEEQAGAPGVLRGATAADSTSPTPQDSAAGKAILLPLVVDRAQIFGALNVEGASGLDETDLVFVSAVVNQIAVALNRADLAASRQARTERKRTNAEARQTAAEDAQIRAEGMQKTAESARGSALKAQTESERREEEAVALRERYQALVDNLDHAFVWQADVRTLRILYVSARAEQLLGIPRTRWSEGTFVEHIHPDDQEIAKRALDQVAAGKRDGSFEARFVAPDGRVRWFHTGIHLAGATSPTPRLEGVSFDITAVKEASEEALARLDFIHAVTGSLGEGVIAVDLQGRLTFINPAAEEMLGWGGQSAVGRPIADVLQILHPGGAVISAGGGPLDRAIRDEAPLRGEDHLFGGRIGPAFPVSYTSAPIRRRSEIVGAVVVFQDVLEIQRNEQVQRFLAEVGALLASSLDHRKTLGAVARSAVPFLADICLVDELQEDGRVERREVVFSDPAKYGLTERVRACGPSLDWRTPQATVLRTGESILLEEARPEAIAHNDDHAQVMRECGVRSMMSVALRARGRTLGALTFVAAESGRRFSPRDLALAEEVGRRSALAIDNARLFERAGEAIQERQDLLAVVSHDLRNPLATILLNTALLLKWPAAQDRRVRGRRYIEGIKRSGERMDRLLGDLVDAASIEAGQLAMEKERRAIAPLVHEAVEQHQAVAEQAGLSLDGRVGDDALEVVCDRDRILQVLGNLIGNAIKFTPEGGAVTIRAEPRGDEMLLSVADTGPGIPAEQLSHIFDRYWQARKTRRLGAGLGLAIAQGLVQAHGGRLWVESQVGRGSTFFLTLPLAPRLPQEESLPQVGPAVRGRNEERQPNPSAPSPRLVVLVVDDDADSREVLCETLEGRGYAVESAANGAEALDRLRTAPAPFLVLLDLEMPIMDGWAVLDETRRDPALRSIPVIVVSGQAGIAGRLAAAGVGYIEKPVQPDGLFETMEQLLH